MLLSFLRKLLIPAMLCNISSKLYVQHVLQYASVHSWLLYRLFRCHNCILSLLKMYIWSPVHLQNIAIHTFCLNKKSCSSFYEVDVKSQSHWIILMLMRNINNRIFISEFYIVFKFHIYTWMEKQIGVFKLMNFFKLLTFLTFVLQIRNAEDYK